MIFFREIAVELNTLIKDCFGIFLDFNSTVVGISADSRDIIANEIFVAIECPNVEKNIIEAKNKGAVLILKEGGNKYDSENRVLYVKNARKALAKLCSNFYIFKPEKMIAVTGTNGKSSVVSITSQILNLIGIKTANIGTLGVNIPFSKDQIELNIPKLTTFDSVSFHKALRALHEKNVKCAVVEATSHGLDQFRLDGVNFDSVGLTNITQDHLDYHNSMQNYAYAKTRLFSDLAKKNSYAVLNNLSDYIDVFKQKSKENKLRIIKYSFLSENSNIHIYDIKETEFGFYFSINIFGEVFENIKFNMHGMFQLENLMCSIGLILGAYRDVELNKVIDVLDKIQPVPGRLEKIGVFKGASIFVDFCHTPDALEKVLLELKKLEHKRIVIVFGCGGERDKTKRHEMGKIASDLADVVIVTDDNPRSEDPAQIRKDILSGANNAIEISGRDAAIEHAIANLDKDDILLVAGRGHELFQKINSVEIPFNDASFIRNIIF